MPWLGEDRRGPAQKPDRRRRKAGLSSCPDDVGQQLGADAQFGGGTVSVRGCCGIGLTVEVGKDSRLATTEAFVLDLPALTLVDSLPGR
jgi:hypothetical protein